MRYTPESRPARGRPCGVPGSLRAARPEYMHYRPRATRAKPQPGTNAEHPESNILRRGARLSRSLAPLAPAGGSASRPFFQHLLELALLLVVQDIKNAGLAIRKHGLIVFREIVQ